jgi:hypothetical protein
MSGLVKSMLSKAMYMSKSQTKQYAASEEEPDMNQSSSGVPEKYFTEEEEPQDKLVGVVVTIYEGESYDEMFREVMPTSAPGERVSTYSIGCRDIRRLHDYMTAAMPVPPAWGNLVDDIQQVEADGVVFNWECCGACGDQPFPCTGQIRSRRGMNLHRPSQRVQTNETMEFMGLAMRRGFTVMCSDFSLKSLIYDWSEQHLGPNPFVKVGECDSQFQLEFVPAELQNEEVPQQLQVVGQLCSDEGKAIVTALGGTIVYTIKPDRPKTDVYDLKVLTVATDFGGSDFGGPPIADSLKCSIGVGESLRRGAAGHVTLNYASGGQLVTSMGHWIELTRINTSLESVMRCVAHEFGSEEAGEHRREYMEQTSDFARYECLQRQSKGLVQKSVPSRMKCRTKF